MIHPETRFLSSSEPGKPHKFQNTVMGQVIPIQKRKNRKERRGDRSQVSPKPRKATLIGSKVLRIILSGSASHLSWS